MHQEVINVMKRISLTCTKILPVDAGVLRACHYIMSRPPMIYFDPELTTIKATVLMHISHRSLRFSKIGEFVTKKSLGDGVVSIAAPPIRLTKRNMTYALQELVEAGYLFCLSVYPIEIKMYGINLPFVLPILLRVAGEAKNLPATRLLRNRLKFFIAECNRLHSILPEFSSTRFESEGECLAKLKDNVTKVLALKRFPRLQKLRETEHGVEEDGSMKAVFPPDKFLDAWDEAVEDAGFDLTIKKRTGSVIGKAKYFLQEMANNGHSPEVIAELIVKVSNNWKWVADEPVLTSNEKLFPLPAVPDFEAFFNYRTQIMAMLYRVSGDFRFADSSKWKPEVIEGKKSQREPTRVPVIRLRDEKS